MDKQNLEFCLFLCNSQDNIELFQVYQSSKQIVFFTNVLFKFSVRFGFKRHISLGLIRNKISPLYIKITGTWKSLITARLFLLIKIKCKNMYLKYFLGTVKFSVHFPLLHSLLIITFLFF